MLHVIESVAQLQRPGVQARDIHRGGTQALQLARLLQGEVGTLNRRLKEFGLQRRGLDGDGPAEGFKFGSVLRGRRTFRGRCYGAGPVGCLLYTSPSPRD